MEPKKIIPLLSEIYALYMDHSFTCEVEPCSCKLEELKEELNNLIEELKDDK